MIISSKRLAEVEAIPDSESDTSDIPELDEAFFANARLIVPEKFGKNPVTVGLDEDMPYWFNASDQRHHSRY